ncbi:MAG: hypothetical protein J7M10_01055 [Candidatus Cloacimonetes bacterium]|nr:hypothetical protein [Candidatus Cloacimonadota bacterium]
MIKDKSSTKKTQSRLPTAVRIILGFLFGLLAGFIWHKVVGCSSGACPIASNYLYSLSFGGIAGILISLF